MEKEKNKVSNGMKILGASLLFLAIPGSALALPWLYFKYKKSKEEKKSNVILGI
jgi:hypothetical protein